jgi:serine/threonine-protein kinase
VVRPLGSVKTPNVVGLTREQAESALTTFALKPEIAEDFSAVVAAGVVIVQAPAAGIAINPGDTVEIVISKGPAPVAATVPSITGKKQSDAEAALKAAGLVPAPYQSYSGTVAKGLVADQNPVAGASMTPGSKVTFVVSLGPAAPTTVGVPNVVGKSQADAEAALRAAGFVPNAVLNVNSTVPKGVVAGQSPTGGSKTAPGAVVGILVSLGPDTSVTVPNVVGKTAEEADAAIKAVGLVPQAAVQPDAEVPKGQVISQGPAAGAKAQAGSTVLYAVSSGTPAPSK